MKILGQKMHRQHLFKHETKRRVSIKFLLVLAVFLLYFLIIALKYGLADGFFVTILTWSFFVLCTPIADAGFLLDFPVRLLTRLRMLYSEFLVWTIAISLNLYAFFSAAEVYEKTKLLQIFHQILAQPSPFWLIILISATGTFLSVTFGDELLDQIHHKDRLFYHKHKSRHRLIIMIFLTVAAIFLYHLLLNKLGVQIEG